MSVMRIKLGFVGLGACLALSLLMGSAGADDPRTPGTPQLFAHARQALTSGAYQDAIDALELLSDQGVTQAEASFNRALAYLARANSANAKSGDLGQAAAGLEEALLLDPDDDEAEIALERLRQEIARAQARVGGSPIIPKPTLGRAVVLLFRENTWAIVAILGSTILTVGLAFLLWWKKPAAQIGAMVAIAAGCLLLLCGGGMAHAARQHRIQTHPAVVMTSAARLLDAAGMPVAQRGPGTAELVEGARVDILETRGALSRVAWGSADGWVNSAQLRRLTSP